MQVGLIRDSLTGSTGTQKFGTTFTSKAAIFFNGIGGTTNRFDQAFDFGRIIGLSAGTGTGGNNRAVTVQGQNGVPAADCDRYTATNRNFVQLDGAGVVVDDWYVSARDSTSITITKPTANNTPRVFGLNLGSSELTNVAIGQFVASTGSTQTVTGVGFRPDSVWIVTNGLTALNSRTDDSIYSWGVGVRTSTGGIKNAVMAGGMDHASDPTVARNHCSTEYCLLILADSVTTIDGAATYGGPTTDGFKLNWVNPPGTTSVIQYLALKGGMHDVLSAEFGTTVGATVSVNPGFTPLGGTVHSGFNDSGNTTGALSSAGVSSWGVFTTPTNRIAASFRESDNVNTTLNRIARVEDAVCVRPVGTGIADVQSISSTALVFVTDNAFPATPFFWTWLIGATTSVSSTTELLAASLSAVLSNTNQIARPDADTSVGSWWTELGSTSNLWQSIDEGSTSRDHTDYVQGRAGYDFTGVTFATTTLQKDGGPNGWLGGTEQGGDLGFFTWLGSTQGGDLALGLGDGSGLGSTQNTPKVTGAVWSIASDDYQPSTPFGGTIQSSRSNVFPLGMVSVAGASTDGGSRIWFSEQDGTDARRMRIGWSDDKMVTRSYNSAGWDYETTNGHFRTPAFVNHGQDYASANSTYVYAIERSWITSSTGPFRPGVTLFRAPKNDVANVSAHEYFSGFSTGGVATWSSTIGDLVNIHDSTGGVYFGVTCVYWPNARRYLMAYNDSTSAEWRMYQSTAVWGPYTLLGSFTNWIDTTIKFCFEPVYKWSDWSTGDARNFWLKFSGTGTYDAFCIVSGTFTTS